MSEDTPRRAPDERARTLANELRGIAQTLVDLELDPEALEAALDGIREIRPLLVGTRRPRWYEAEVPSSFGTPTADSFDTISPVRGRLNVVAPPLRIEFAEREDGTPSVVGHARLPSLYEGPPRGVHGGLVAALFDEILGASMALAPPPGVTAQLEVDYRHLTPIDEPLRLEAWISEVRGRRIHAQATCHAGETLTATARALFVRVDFKAVEDRMRARGGA